MEFIYTKNPFVLAQMMKQKWLQHLTSVVGSRKCLVCLKLRCLEASPVLDGGPTLRLTSLQFNPSIIEASLICRCGLMACLCDPVKDKP